MSNKNIITLTLILFIFTSITFAQDFTQYEDNNLPSTQYTPAYQNNNQTEEVGQNYLQTSESIRTTSLNDIKAYCPHQFKVTLKQGDRSNEVKILQAILNSDSRTIVASSGIGSPGSETSLYGAATKDAVKRFQALFISPELGAYAIPIANGVVGPKTRIFLNAICNDERFYTGKTQAQSVVTGPVSSAVETNSIQVTNSQTTQQVTTQSSTCTKEPMRVSLQAYTRSVKCDKDAEACESFKVKLNTSEPLATIEKDAIGIDGDASVGDIRKLSKTEFQIFITPTGKSKTVGIQIPADKLTSSCNKVNEIASNEVIVSTSAQTTNPATGITQTSSTSEMIAALNAQLNAKLAEISTLASSTTNNTEAKRLQEEKDKLQKEIDELKKQNNQNCQQGLYGTVCQSPQQAQAAQQAAQNDALMRALAGMGQGQKGQQPNGGGGGSMGGGGGAMGPGSDKTIPPTQAAKEQADEAKALADRLCKADPNSEACKKAKDAAAAAKATSDAAVAEQKARTECIKNAKTEEEKTKCSEENNSLCQGWEKVESNNKCTDASGEEVKVEDSAATGFACAVITIEKSAFGLKANTCIPTDKIDVIDTDKGRLLVQIGESKLGNKFDLKLPSPKAGQCVALGQKISVGKITCYNDKSEKCDISKPKTNGKPGYLLMSGKFENKPSGQNSCVKSQQPHQPQPNLPGVYSI